MASTRLHELKVIHNSAQRQKTKDKKGDVSAAAFLGPGSAAQRRKEATQCWEEMSPIEQVQKLADDLKKFSEPPAEVVKVEPSWKSNDDGAPMLMINLKSPFRRVSGMEGGQ